MRCAFRRLAAPFAALLPVLLTVAAGQGSDPAASVAAAAGHPARERLHAEAVRVRAGETEILVLETAGGARLERRCADGLCGGSWFDGRRAFTFGLNAMPLPAEDEGRERTFAAIASTWFGEADFVTSGGAVEPPVRSPDGKLRFTVCAPQGSSLVAVADGQTGRLTAVEFPDGSRYRTLIASVSGGHLVYSTQRYDRVVPLAAPIAAPAGPHIALQGSADLTAQAGPLPVVACSLAGRKAACLLDSGTAPSAMTLGFAEQLDLEPHGRIEIASLGDYLTGVVDGGPLVLGAATFERLSFAVIPRARGTQFDIILGSDALAALRVVFDPGHSRISIGPSRVDADGSLIALSFRAGLPYAQVKLGARERTESMLLDTGDAGTLSIGYDEYREDLGLFAVRGGASASGIGGSMDALEGRLDRAVVGNEPLDGVPISAVRGQHTGHVGYGFAARCGRLALELARERAECLAPEPPVREQTGN